MADFLLCIFREQSNYGTHETMQIDGQTRIKSFTNALKQLWIIKWITITWIEVSIAATS